MLEHRSTDAFTTGSGQGPSEEHLGVVVTSSAWDQSLGFRERQENKSRSEIAQGAGKELW